MSTHTRSGVARGGAREDGRDGMSRMSPEYVTMGNQTESVSLERSRRQTEVQEALRQAVGYMARAIQVAVPPARRSREDSQFLSDCLRTSELRKAFSEETIVRLFCIASQASEPIHALSGALTVLEVRMSAATPLCPTEASDAEDDSNRPLDHAQKLWERERTPVRAAQILEIAHQQLVKTKALIRAFTPLARSTP